jgi:hypothetical protein
LVDRLLPGTEFIDGAMVDDVMGAEIFGAAVVFTAGFVICIVTVIVGVARRDAPTAGAGNPWRRDPRRVGASQRRTRS